MRNNKKLLLTVFMNIVVGIILGCFIHSQITESTSSYLEYIKLIYMRFISFVEMIIASVFFCCLIVGIFKMKAVKILNKIEVRVISKFLVSFFVGDDKNKGKFYGDELYTLITDNCNTV